MWNLNCLMLYVCVGGALATVHIWKSERLLGVDSLSFYHVGSGIELG